MQWTFIIFALLAQQAHTFLRAAMSHVQFVLPAPQARTIQPQAATCPPRVLPALQARTTLRPAATLLQRVLHVHQERTTLPQAATPPYPVRFALKALTVHLAKVLVPLHLLLSVFIPCRPLLAIRSR
jgi:hypothetical protein